jgi:peptide/nickel transport system substrate-binding protein
MRRRAARRGSWVAGVALLGLLLSACGGTKTTSETPQEGGQLILSENQEAKSFHPFLVTDVYSSNYRALHFASLMQRDSKAELKGVLASDWKISDDQLTITINLKKDLKWSDGNPITADDVQFTFDRFIKKENDYPFLSTWAQVASLKAASPTQVVVKMKEVFAPILDNFTGRDGTVLPKHIWEKLNWKDNPEMQKPTVGSGPFLLEEWKRDDHATFKANPTYTLGKPHLDRLIWKVYPNSTAQFAAQRNGEVDLGAITADNYPDAKNQPNLKLTVYQTVGGSITYVGFNNTKPELQDVKVRRAMTYALDRKTVIDKVNNGLSVPLESWIGPKSPFYDKNVEKDAYNYDPAKAKALLDEAGWKVGADGIREKDGKKLKLRYLGSTGSKIIQDVFTYYQQYWKAVGIDVVPDFQEFQSLLARLNTPNRDYDLWTLGWNAGYDPDGSMSHFAKDTSFSKRSKYDNPRVQALIKQGTQTFDFNKRKQAYDEIQEILHKDQPYLFGWVAKSVVANSSKVGGLDVGLLGWYQNQQDWYSKSKSK